jgi:hypothetical protein
MHLELLKDMFDRMVLKKDASLIPFFYHEDFILYANGEEMGYESYLKLHQEVYATPIQYQIAYDQETLVEQGNKVAGRVWITITQPEQQPKKIEVILIASFKEGKIHRLWELTSPDWSKLPEFQ